MEMEFFVLARANDSANVPPQVAITLARQTFQTAKAKPDPRVKATYLFAGESAGALIIDAKSGDELEEILSSFPLSGISKFEVHPLVSIDTVLKSIDVQEKRMAAMTPAGVG